MQFFQIRRDEFEECEMLESLMLSHNRITTFNSSLLNLKKLNFVNVSYNLLEEFSFHEIFGLEELRSIDLSYNRIKKVVGPAVVSVMLFKRFKLYFAQVARLSEFGRMEHKTCRNQTGQ